MEEKRTDELLTKIYESAEDIDIPEGLLPENVANKLSFNSRRKKLKALVSVAAAALIVIICGVSAFTFSQRGGKQDNETVASVDTEEEKVHTKKEKVGEYRLAKNYEEVEDAVLNGYMSMQDSVTAESDSTGAEDSGEFSTTNLQVEGIDEADFIKNDGNYLYLQSEECVRIVDISKDKMTITAKIKPDLGTSDTISDMYVDGDRLYLIVVKRVNEVTEGSDDSDYSDLIAYNSLYIGKSYSTELLTYDISDRTDAKLMGTVEVDGYINTSRKVGDYIYLFSERYVVNSSDDDTDEVIPEVNGDKIPADCIFVRDNATKEFIVVSVDVNDPGETVDQMVLLDADMDVYMGEDAIYLYEYDFSWGNTYTDITKFSYKDGYMDAVETCSVKGTIDDTFSISEENGMLRVLTTNTYSEDSTNRLYLFDENMKKIGQLDGIATGEEIYAARYIGDIAYIITYHNTDPLFAVDISDPANPTLLGQIKMTGYSDYLHPFGENMLVGIGYETDPDTSERLGIKLTMYDVSNPLNLKILDSVVIKGDDISCRAAYNYKCALVDYDKNLIGFNYADYSEDNEQGYLLYSWDEDHFTKKLQEKLSDLNNEDQIRGLYAENTFYQVSQGSSGFQIKSYDMENDFKEIDLIK